jgi:PAS domain S-box-containing protein
MLRELAGLISFMFVSIAASNTQLETLHESWRWRLFTAESGLPSNTVYDVIEHPNGTVWANTHRGLAWYDGFRWHRTDPTIGFPAQRVDRLISYGADEVLAITLTRLYRGSSNGFRYVPIVWNGEELAVHSMLPMADSVVLLYTVPGLFLYDGSSIRPFPMPHRGERLTDGNANLWRTPTGDVWFNTRNGLYRLEKDRWVPVMHHPNNYYGIKAIIQNKEGFTVAAVTLPLDEQGLWEWTRDGIPQRSRTERSSLVQSLDAAPNGLIVAAYESGEVRVRVNGMWNNLSPLPAEMSNILFLRFRPNGDLWVGTERGLYLHRQSSRRWETWRHPFPDLHNSVHEIYQTTDGSIWLGTMKGVEIRRTSGRIEQIEQVLGQPLNLVTGIVQDDAGAVWICSGASFEGAYRWDGKTWKHFGPNEGLLAPRVHKIRKDRKGRLWFMGMGINYADPINQPGAFVYDGSSFQRWSREEGLPSGRMYGFAEHPDGSYWFASFGGLSRWRDGTWKHWRPGAGLPATGRIPALAIDLTGKIWFTDQRTGLGFINERDEAEFLTVEDGLVSPEIWDMRVDSSNTLWISTRAGLSSLSNGVFSTFTTKNGLHTMRLWEVLPLSDRVYIGSSGSGVRILHRDEPSPAPRVEVFQPVIDQKRALLRWQAFTSWGELPPSSIETRYRVNDGPWSRWTTVREIQLSDLEVGTHRVTIQAKGMLGNFDERGEEVWFKVEPGLLEHPAFLLPLGGFGIAFLVMGGAYIRRKQKQDAALRASENRYRAVVEDQTEFICRFRPDGTLTFVNEAYSRYFNKRPEELVGKNFKQFLQPEDVPMVEAHLARLGRLSPLSTYEHRITTPTGELRWQQWTDRAILDGRERVVEIQSVGRDITERKHAEEARRIAEQKYRDIVEHALEGIYRSSPDGTFLSVNPAMARIFGYVSPLEMMVLVRDIPTQIYVHPEERARLLELLNRNGAVHAYEYEARRKDGTHIWVACSARAVRNPNGSIAYYEGSITDITERKQTQQVLEEERRLLRTLVEALPDEIALKDTKSRFVIVNEGTVRALRAAGPQDVLGKTDFSFVRQPLAQEQFEEEQEILRSRKPIVNKELVRFNRETGAIERCILTTKLPLSDSNGEVVGLLAINRDITERKQAEEALRGLPKRILDAQESERKRVARELHDGVNQILASAKFRLELALERTSVRSHVGRENYERAKALLDQAMLEVRRISRNLRPSVLDDFGLVPALSNLTAEFSTRTRIETTFKYSKRLPSLSKEIEVAIYRVAQEAFTNIEKHARTQRVLMNLRRCNDTLTFAVKDYGEGIDPQQAHGNGKRHTGLGLVDMKERASMVGGTFSVSSRPRRGTEIRVDIPLTIRELA